MTDRTDTSQEAAVSKFNAAPESLDTGSKKLDGQDGLHQEFHALSQVGASRSDLANQGKSQTLDTPSLPPLSIDGPEAKTAPESTPEATPETTDQTVGSTESFTLEVKLPGQFSIRGQERYLDTEAAKLTSVNMEADGKPAEAAAAEEVPASPVPEDLKAIVGPEREQEFRQAFELMDRFDKSVNEEVLQPGIKKFTEMLDQAERDMPKEKLDALEAERKKYGLELEAYNEANQEPSPDSPPTMQNLLYHAPPERGKEMKEFDRTVQKITAAVGKEMAENMQAVGAKFNKDGGALNSADDLVQEYYQRKEDLTPRPEPEVQLQEA
ncbi:MAG: hypothetical protein QG574_977 [Cyanobacteriota bacterium erpe_2018_sw_21hr_WHONDRS-SW48-000092_B_bin.40]|jgi:hypothetical protein|nr:hypothetical protein [Cyanobacteriota bacterium erpe_2018_sw_21hr_WHONDRS-SW48-000092_B_bin.40]